MLKYNCVGTFCSKLRIKFRSPIHSSKRLNWPGVNLHVSFLAKIKREAKRRRVWFKLSRVERAVFDLTLKCVTQPRSLRLIYALAKIIVKIKALLANPLRWLMNQIGKPMARRLSKIAEGWGNKEAARWVQDESFIRFLTVTDKIFQSSNLERTRDNRSIT